MGGDGDEARTCRVMSGQFLSEAIQAKPNGEARVSETRVRVERAYPPGTRPRSHEGVLLVNLARVGRERQCKNHPQQNAQVWASVEGRDLAHVVRLKGGRVFNG